MITTIAITLSLIHIFTLIAVEADKDSTVHQSGGVVDHSAGFKVRIPHLMMSSIFVAGLDSGTDLANWGWGTLAVYSSWFLVLASIFWLAFDMSMNIINGFGWDYTGQTSEIDSTIYEWEKKIGATWLDILIKGICITGSCFLFKFCLTLV